MILWCKRTQFPAFRTVPYFIVYMVRNRINSVLHRITVHRTLHRTGTTLNINRPLYLRCNVGFLTVITVPTVITLYSMVQITVGQIFGVRPYKMVPTLQYDFDRNLAVWLQFCRGG